MSEVITFSFADEVARHDYLSASLGRVRDDRTERLGRALFHLSEPVPAAVGRPLLRRNVPHRVDESDQTLQESVAQTVDFFAVGGKLSINLAVMGAEGGLEWQREAAGSRTSVHILQKCTCVVGYSAIDLPALSAVLATTDTAELGRYLHADLLAAGGGGAGASAAGPLGGVQGTRFVSKVLQGGVMFRRITFSSRSAKTIDTLRAHLSAWVGVGPFKISFALEFLLGAGRRATAGVNVAVQTFVAGGDRGIFQDTVDLAEATRQLEQWQRSVRLPGRDGRGGTAVPVAAELTPVSDYVPTRVLGWSAAGLEAYRAHVADAVRARTRVNVRIAAVEAAIEGAFDALTRAGLDRGAANARIDPVRRHKDILVREYLVPWRRRVEQYLSRPAHEIRGSAWVPEDEHESDDDEGEPQQQPGERGHRRRCPRWREFEELYASLCGERRVRMTLRLPGGGGGRGTEDVDALWCGPFCPAGGVGPFGEPECVWLLRPPLAGRGIPGAAGAAAPPRGGRGLSSLPVLAKVSCSGWDLLGRGPFTGLHAVVSVQDQKEEAPLAPLLPRALRPAYTGRMQYLDGGEYKGAWAHGRRHGHGTMRYADGSVYVGQWASDAWHGHGELRASPCSTTVFRGTFERGRKHGVGAVVPAAAGAGAAPPAANHTWEHDVLVVKGPLACEEAFGKVRSLPPAYRKHWRGTRIEYGGGCGDRGGGDGGGDGGHDGGHDGAAAAAAAAATGASAGTAGAGGGGGGRGGGPRARSRGGEYTGEYSHEQRHGRGVMTWADGTTCAGPWLQDKHVGEHAPE